MSSLWLVLCLTVIGNFVFSEADLIYPCNVHNTNCIRKFFAKHSDCTIVDGPAPSPWHLNEITMYLASVNTTVIDRNVEIYGLNTGKINVFYVNPRTNNLVLEVVFPRLFTRAETATLMFYRKGKEAIKFVAPVKFTEYNVSITMVAPCTSDSIDLSEAYFYAYIPDPNENYYFDVNPEDEDPEVKAALAVVKSKESITLREDYITKAPRIMKEYIQTNICKFPN